MSRFYVQISLALVVAVLPRLAVASDQPAGARTPKQSGRAAPPSSASPSSPTPSLELIRRTLTITDETLSTVAEIHVAEGVPTSIAFQIPLRTGGVLLADAQDVFYPPQAMERVVLLVPKKAPRPGALTTLTVTLEDGTILPFRLTTHPSRADVQVDVVLQLEARASPESPAALRAANTQLRAQLDECQATQGRAGIRNVASLIVAQDAERPQTFIVERRELRALDKQSRLLVQVRQVYRLFDYTYVVLTVENRDPTRAWVLDRPEVKVDGGGEAADAKVEAFVAEMNALPPDEVERVVIAFKTPEQTASQTYTLQLFEKNGNRHVRLEGLRL